MESGLGSVHCEAVKAVKYPSLQTQTSQISHLKNCFMTKL